LGPVREAISANCRGGAPTTIREGFTQGW